MINIDVKEAILNRRAIRAFKSNPLSDDQLRAIVQTAQKAPSWVDSQPGRIIIATGDKLSQMRKTHRKLNEDASVHANSDVPFIPAREWDEASQLNMSTRSNSGPTIFGQAKWDQMKGNQSSNLFDAPAVAYLTLPENYTQWSLYDLGAMGEAIMIAAQGLGIDSIPAFEFVKYPDKLRTTLHVDANRQFIVGIGLGYANPDAQINQINASRMDLDDVLKIIK